MLIQSLFTLSLGRSCVWILYPHFSCKDTVLVVRATFSLFWPAPTYPLAELMAAIALLSAAPWYPISSYWVTNACRLTLSLSVWVEPLLGRPYLCFGIPQRVTGIKQGTTFSLFWPAPIYPLAELMAAIALLSAAPWYPISSYRVTNACRLTLSLSV